MKYAIVVDSAALGPMAYVAECKMVAPIKPMTVRLCCGEPKSTGAVIDASGRYSHGLKCCEQYKYQPVKAGDRISGELVDGIFEPYEINYPLDDSLGYKLITGSDNLFQP